MTRILMIAALAALSLTAQTTQVGGVVVDGRVLVPPIAGTYAVKPGVATPANPTNSIVPYFVLQQLRANSATSSSPAATVTDQSTRYGIIVPSIVAPIAPPAAESWATDIRSIREDRPPCRTPASPTPSRDVRTSIFTNYEPPKNPAPEVRGRLIGPAIVVVK